MLSPGRQCVVHITGAGFHVKGWVWLQTYRLAFVEMFMDNLPGHSDIALNTVEIAGTQFHINEQVHINKQGPPSRFHGNNNTDLDRPKVEKFRPATTSPA